MRPFAIKPRTLFTLSLACASIAQADIVTFDTEVIQVACTPDLNSSGSPSAVITLPEIKVSALGGRTGNTAGETTFTIGLNSCGDKVPAGTLAGAYFYGTEVPWLNDGNVSNVFRGVYNGRLVGTSSDGGFGWKYQLLPGSGDTQINVYTSAAKPADSILATLPSVDISSGSGTLTYRVRYYHSRRTYSNASPTQINPGTRTAQATYVIYYR